MSQCSHSPHRQCLERRLAHSHWMPASHSNDHLPVLSDIQPVELRRTGVTLSFAHRRSLDPNHILYDLLCGSSDTRQVRIRSRHLFEPTARNLWTTLPDLASSLLNRKITNGKRNTVKMRPGSVFCARDQCQAC